MKTEILNWQGGSVYSTTVNTYNARDQVTLIRQFQGTAPFDPNDLSCPTGTCQQTTMTYHGHGRLQTRHIPQQNAGTNTVWAYNSDDTIQTITDARVASQTMTYNGRHLVTGVTYAAPSPIPAPSPVTYVYDASGNRTSMSDGTGTTTHLYDTLSRMTSETRTFQGIPGSFTLTYATISQDRSLRSLMALPDRLTTNMTTPGECTRLAQPATLLLTSISQPSSS